MRYVVSAFLLCVSWPCLFLAYLQIHFAETEKHTNVGLVCLGFGLIFAALSYIVRK